MVKKYKKGEVFELIYRPSGAVGTARVTGIVIKISDAELILAHNFLASKPIDITAVPLRDILESQKIIPKEINFLRDLKIRPIFPAKPRYMLFGKRSAILRGWI